MGSVSILRVSRRAASSPMKYKFCTCHSFYFSGGTVLIPSVEDEVADIFFYLVRFCQVMDIDLEKAFYYKMKKNAEKYPNQTK